MAQVVVRPVSLSSETPQIPKHVELVVMFHVLTVPPPDTEPLYNPHR